MERFHIGNKANESLNEDLDNTHTLNWHKAAANVARNYFLQLLFNP